MNLYEQVIDSLGGYEKCKEILKTQNIDMLMNVQALREHMLEHRRQNNIFEVGDFVVGLTSETNEIFEIESTSNKLNRKGEKTYAVTFIGKEGLLVGLQYRHATPEEIAAGHRL